MSTIFNVLRRPIVTEKTNYMNEKLHQYTFEVASDASKTLIKDAVETIFDVDVLNVNVINVAVVIFHFEYDKSNYSSFLLSHNNL